MATKGQAEVLGCGEVRTFGVRWPRRGGVYTRTGHIFQQAITSSAFTLVLATATLFPVTAAAQPSLGTTAALEGPAAGSDSVVLAMANPTDTWTATANDAWLHLSVANQSGVGSTNVVFSYDANPVGTRTGTLTIAGQTLTVTQAGSTYVAAPSPVTLLAASGLNSPTSVAVDGAGNVYMADYANNAIKKWTAATNTVTTLVVLGTELSLGGGGGSCGQCLYC